jgi:hypothetical protein
VHAERKRIAHAFGDLQELCGERSVIAVRRLVDEQGNQRDRIRVIAQQAHRGGHFANAECQLLWPAGHRVWQLERYCLLRKGLLQPDKVVAETRKTLVAREAFRAAIKNRIERFLCFYGDDRTECNGGRHDAIEYHGTRRIRVSTQVMLRDTAAVRHAVQV